MKHGIACYCQHSFAYIFIPPSFSLMYRGSPHLYSQHLVRFPLVRNFLSHHQKVRPKINHELLLQTLFCIFFCPPLLYIYRWKLCCKPILELPVEFITKYFVEVIVPSTRGNVIQGILTFPVLHISWFMVPEGFHEMWGSWIPRTVFSVKP